MPDILHRIEIKASSEQVYAALTEESGLAGWWTREVKAGLHFQFGDYGFSSMKLTELKPGERVAWQCVEGGPGMDRH
jgi:uncharacterized protein YndB with AHSA1/START domain